MLSMRRDARHIEYIAVGRKTLCGAYLGAYDRRNDDECSYDDDDSHGEDVFDMLLTMMRVITLVRPHARATRNLSNFEKRSPVASTSQPARSLSSC